MAALKEIKANESSTLNLTDKQKEILDKLPESIKQFAYIVGAWIWVRFPAKPKDETLKQIKELEFRYNSERKVWQHNCGRVCFKKSPFDPREKYGCVSITEQSFTGSLFPNVN